VDHGATVGALARISAAAGNEVRTELLFLRDDSTRHYGVADVPPGEWVSNAPLPVPTASADASGATLVPTSRWGITEGHLPSRRGSGDTDNTTDNAPKR